MYANPKDIRNSVVKLRMTDDKKELLNQLAMFRREQPAKLAHDLLLAALDDLDDDIKNQNVKEVN